MAAAATKLAAVDKTDATPATGLAGPTQALRTVGPAIHTEAEQAALLARSAPIPRAQDVLMPPEVAQAISEVMAAVRSVEKNGRNEFHKYDFARVEDLLVKVQPAMVAAGLIIVQSEVANAIIGDGKVATVTYAFRLLHRSGAGYDNPAVLTGMASLFNHKGTLDDKAFNKCHTGARKYFLLSLLQVPTGDIPDVDDNGEPGSDLDRGKAQDQGGPPTNATVVAAQRLAIDLCVNEAEMATWKAAFMKVKDSLRVDERNSLITHFQEHLVRLEGRATNATVVAAQRLAIDLCVNEAEMATWKAAFMKVKDSLRVDERNSLITHFQEHLVRLEGRASNPQHEGQ